MAISADLGAALEAVVNDLVANGRYNSKSEVLREGVRLVQEREAALLRLQGVLENSVSEFESGHSRDLTEVVQELVGRYQVAEEV